MKRKVAALLFALFVCLPLAAGPVLAQGKDTAKKAGPPADTKQKTELIDINSASKQELMTLPGIGDAYSQKIIDNRPYRGKNELIQKKIIPQATYDKISGQIIAKQNSSAPAAKKK
jgi:DNA uptake protein ComE-like DNA-binding protein